MTTQTRAQISMDETRVDDSELEQLLEDREELKRGRNAYQEADKKAKEAIAKVTAPSPFRVGRFVITRNPVEGKEVSFETKPTTRVSIKLAGE